MGLDIGVFPFVKIPDDVNTEEELNKWCNDTGNTWVDLGCDGRVPDQWIKYIRFKVLNKYEMFKQRALDAGDYELFDQTPEYTIYEPVYDDPGADYVQFQKEDYIYHYERIPVYAHGKEIGYQRKGANAAFYDAGLWGSDVFTEAELLEHWNKYFSDPNDEMYGKCARSHFAKHIIKNFKEGETFVSYY